MTALRVWGYLLLTYAGLLIVAAIGNLGRVAASAAHAGAFLWDLALPAAYVITYAIGLIRLRSWARIMGIFGGTLCLAKSLYDVLLATQLPYFRVLSIVKIPVAAALVFYLTRPQVKLLFQGVQPIAVEATGAVSPPIRWIAYICSFLPIFGFVFYFAFRRRDKRFAQNCLGMAILGILFYGFFQTRIAGTK